MDAHEHVGELELHLTAASVTGIFEQAARLLAEEEAPEADLDHPGGEPLEVALPGGELGGLLVDWLNELIYLTEMHDRPYPHARVSRADEERLEATLRAVEAPVRHAVKAATLHGVEVRRANGGWQARVLVDV